MAERILMNEFKSLNQEKWVNVQLHNDDIFAWNIALIVINPDSLYYGGYFRAKMAFPKNYPYLPPTFQFTRSLFHPNIYPDGKLCISILHTPGDDEMSGETSGERWSPVQRVESVLLSIISLLDDAECSSPANVDAGIMLRKDPTAFKAKVKADVEDSREDIPIDFVMPTHESTVETSLPIKDDDVDFWMDSDQEDDLGGSDTDAIDIDSGAEEDDDDLQGNESADEGDDDYDVPDTKDQDGNYKDDHPVHCKEPFSKAGTRA